MLLTKVINLDENCKTVMSQEAGPQYTFDMPIHFRKFADMMTGMEENKESTFDAVSIDTTGYTFDREEANER